MRQEQLERFIESVVARRITNPAHQKRVKEYLLVRRQVDKVATSTRANAVQGIVTLAEHLDRAHGGVAFEDASPEMLMEWAERLTKPAKEGGSGFTVSTQVTYMICVKHFYKFLGNPAEYRRGKQRQRLLEYPAAVEWMDTTRPGQDDPIPVDSILTREEVFRMIQVTREPHDKALIATLWDTGFRLSECAALKVGSYQSLGPQHGELLLPKQAASLKTGARRVIVVDAKSYVERWLRDHPFGSCPDAPLFCNRKGRRYARLTMKMALRAAWESREHAAPGRNGPTPPEMTSEDWESLRPGQSSVAFVLRNAAELAGIKKHVHPHLLRHSRATWFAARNVHDSVQRKRFGWTNDSAMPARYQHLSGQQEDAIILQAQGIEVDEAQAFEENLFTPKTCPKGHRNEPTANFCTVCSTPLNLALILENPPAAGRQLLQSVQDRPDRLGQQFGLYALWVGQEQGWLDADGNLTEAALKRIAVRQARETVEQAEEEKKAEAKVMAKARRTRAFPPPQAP